MALLLSMVVGAWKLIEVVAAHHDGHDEFNSVERHCHNSHNSVAKEGVRSVRNEELGD